MSDKKLSAKQRQAEINKSRKRWVTLFKVAAGAGLLLMAGMIWPDGDREDTDTSTGSGVQDTRPVHQ